MLSQISSTPSTNIAYVNPKQIAAGSVTSSAVVYTVPTGKKFQGYITSWTTAGGSSATIAGVTIYIPSPIQAINLTTLVAGTSVLVNNTTNGVQVFGVETDA